VLVLVWLAGRVAVTLSAEIGWLAAMLIDVAFGRPLSASPGLEAIYGLIVIAAVARIVAAVLPDWSTALLHVAAFAWAAAFLGFAGLYAPLLCLPKRPSPRRTAGP
jgi:uncharacterized protein involved in response to NO